MTEFEHKRQQWAVGHGFFHTACIELENRRDKLKKNLYRYVYDCGSSRKKTIEREIDLYVGNENIEGRKKPIDLLVISHFHSDHINGVPYLLKKCKIKKLVLPYLTDMDEILTLAYLASLGPQEWESLSGLVINPQQWLADNGSAEAEVVHIASDGESSGNMPLPDDGNGLVLGKAGEAKTNQGSPGVIFLNKYPVWSFKFYFENNIAQATQVLNHVLNCLKIDQKTLLDNLRDTVWIKSNWPAIKNSFTSLKSIKQNSTNLSMFSGPVTDHFIERVCFHRNGMAIGQQIGCAHSFCSCSYKRRNTIGWLGTGDAEIKDKNSYSKFKKGFDTYLDQLDTVTVPHHGSRNNYNHDFGSLSLRYVITSNFKIDPKDHHPASEVILNLKTKCRLVHIVTTDPASALFDSFKGVILAPLKT